MYEAQLTSKSLLNQEAFCWSVWRICVTKLLPNENGEIFHPQAEFQIVLNGISHKNPTNNSKCDHTFRTEYILFATVPLRL